MFYMIFSYVYSLELPLFRIKFCYFKLLAQMKALKDLGLDVAKGTVTTEGSEKRTKFFITRL